MKKMSRREVCVGLPVAAFAASALGQAHTSEFPAPKAAPQQTGRTMPVQDKPGPVGAAGTMGGSRAIPLDEMPVRTMANGGESRGIAHGTLATGESVNLHQSMQPVGMAPNPAHVIQHTEFILVREGELEFQHEVDGKMVAEKVGPGGAFYVAPGTKHAVKNAGSVPAKYFVVAIGGDAK